MTARREKKIPLQIPAIVELYNAHMGGVNRVDHMIALYRSNLRSKKFNHKTFFHFLDMMCASSWQDYTEDCKALGIQKKIKTLLVFKTEIAESSCKAGKSCAQKKRGRPSSSVETEFQIKAKRGPAKAISSLSVQTDQIGHFPQYEEKKKEDARCQDAKESQKYLASSAKLIYALHQAAIVF